MLRTIRAQIGLPFILLILGVMLALAVYLSFFARQTALQALEERLEAEARLAAEALPSALTGSPDTAYLDGLARSWAKTIGGRVTIIARDGAVIGESHADRESMDNHSSRPEIIQAAASGLGMETRYSETTGYDMLYAAVPVQQTGQITGFVRFALPLTAVQANLRQLQVTLAGVTLAAALLAGALAAWLAGRVTRPISQLTLAARQMAAGQSIAQLPPARQDEISELNQAFNRMASELNEKLDALETERSRMSAVLQVMTDGVVIADRDGRVQLVNATAESMFDIVANDVQGSSLIQALRQHQITELWRQSLESGESHSDTFEIPARKLYLHCVATPLGQALPGYTLLLFQNLTRLRRLETVRQDFISNISHELRTPLASLKALTETLLDSAIDDPPAARRFLLRMETEVDALTQMVEELLELSRIESGRVPLRLAPAAASDLISGAVERLAMQAERAGLSVTVNCPAGLPPVLADRQRLEQVLVNLLHNAIKFTPPGGSIEMSAAAQEGRVVFSVTDSGVGIPQKDLPRIFERFYKADRARASKGTGLGLAIARHQVEAHGGAIWAESKDGQGSTFYFSIPVVA